MFFPVHYGYQVSFFDQWLIGASAGENQFNMIGPCFDKGPELILVNQMPMQTENQFIENHEIVIAGSSELSNFGKFNRQGFAHGSDLGLIFNSFLHVPGLVETFQGELTGKLLSENCLTGFDIGGFQKLTDIDFAPSTEHAPGESEGGGGFALAVAGVNLHQTFFQYRQIFTPSPKTIQSRLRFS